MTYSNEDINTINKLIPLISKNLNITIDKSKFSILNKIGDDIIQEINIEHIKSLLKSDTEFKNFEDEYNLNNNETFKIFKNELGKLQILILLKTLNKAKNCDDVLNVFIKLLNNKFNSVNNILENNLKGGCINNINFYKNKYLKYKIKYLIYKFNI